MKARNHWSIGGSGKRFFKVSYCQSDVKGYPLAEGPLRLNKLCLMRIFKKTTLKKPGPRTSKTYTTLVCVFFGMMCQTESNTLPFPRKTEKF